jgi:uncharacterized protein (TIGR03435 family)
VAAETSTVRILGSIPLNRRELSLRLSVSVSLFIALVLASFSAFARGAQLQTQSAAPVPPAYEYDVVSVKPSPPGTAGRGTLNTADGYSAKHIPLIILIEYAYGIRQQEQLSGYPQWTIDEDFDVDAKMDNSVADALQKMNTDERTATRRHMLQTLLADRFALKAHRETKELSVYALIIAKSGSKLAEAKPGDTYPNGFRGSDGRPLLGSVMLSATADGVTMTGQAAPVSYLAQQLAQQINRIVLDKTGLAGNFDFKMQFTPENYGRPATPTANGMPASDPGGASIFTAVQEQLGLKLETVKAPTEVIVIDHVQRPSGN